ncbi:MAG: S1C family serine protease [Acidimicrobiia bacterium]
MTDQLLSPPPNRPAVAPEDAWTAGSTRRERRLGSRSWSVRFVAVTLVALLAGAAGGWLGARADSGGEATAGIAVDRASTQLDGETLDVAGVVANVQQSVVSIEAAVVTRQGPFGTEGEGAGTGVVLDDGYILTNAHVVEDATDISVTAPGDDESQAAELVASDSEADLAVLHVSDTDGLMPAPLGSSADLQVGDQVVAVGNALALEGGMTVTQGIVSAVDRSIDTEDGTLSGLIQTDAAISSGNSGGPLVNATGEVVGINTAVATSGGGVSASNIGFAISIDTARSVADRLLADAS